MHSTADNRGLLPESSSAPKLPFTPSQNWRVLQKSLPQEHSKKRKRSGPPATKSNPISKKERMKSTTYNPWRPNDSQFQKKGNSALVIQPSMESDKAIKPGRYVALDCEMVGVGPNGEENALARVSIVNYYGNVLLDAYVSPNQRVTDWRTKYSGIRPADVLNPDAFSFDRVQLRVSELLKDRILVGHALKGDLEVLKLTHPRNMVRDTCLYEPFRVEYGSGRKPSLKKIAEGVLGVTIQTSEHDSIEDAQAAMALYRHVHDTYEKAIRMGHPNGPRPSPKLNDMKETTDNSTPAITENPRVKKRRKLKKE